MSSLFEKYLRTLHFWSSVLSVVLSVYLYKHKRQDTIATMIPCLCSFTAQKIPRPNGLGMWWTVQDSNL